MELYNKYRPTTLNRVVGNKGLKREIKAKMDLGEEEFPKVLLFHGPHGCGKTSFAQLIAKWFGVYDSSLPLSHNRNYTELDSAQYTGIDNIRELRKNAEYRGHGGKKRVFCLDEVHRLSPQAQEALLKLLEKPPGHCCFILCTTEPEKLIKTVRSRCMPFMVSLLDDEDMVIVLKRICKWEDKQVPVKVLEQIAADSFGSSRDAIQILDRIIDLDEADMLESAKETALRQNKVIELCQALIKEKSWKVVAKIISGLKTEDPEKIRRTMRGYMQTILLGGKIEAVAIRTLIETYQPTYNNGFTDITQMCCEIVSAK